MSQTTEIDDPLAQLSQGQRDCLRLVGQYMSSKEIARELGISPHTVDQRLKRATFLLGLNSRTDAARLFSSAQSQKLEPSNTPPLYGDLVYQASGLSAGAEAAMFDPSLDTLNRSSDGAHNELHEQQAPYYNAAKVRENRTSIWSVLVEANRENELTTQFRILVMILIVIFSIIGVGALISIAEGLSRLS